MSPPAPSTIAPAAFATALTYTDRRTKARYIADKYAPILTGSVLDVGCDEAPLRKLVMQPFKYVGLDVRDDADVRVNLEQNNLPFPDRSFDTVVCTDVLEHLDRCHDVFDELCRVARTHIVASLPNPLRNLLTSLAEGSEGRIKYYGLPVEKPVDRHKWFFGHDEACEFFRGRAQRNGFAVIQLDSEEGGCPSWRREGVDHLGSTNVRGGTIWCALRRAGS